MGRQKSIRVLLEEDGKVIAPLPPDVKDEFEAAETLDLARQRTGEQVSRYAQFGLCAGCANFAVRELAIGGDTEIVARCMSAGTLDWDRRRLLASKPVVTCSEFFPAGQMPLSLMANLAHPIQGPVAKNREWGGYL